jgi:hypothetical protein
MAMPKPLGATMRNLFELEPAAWLEFFGAPVPDPGLVGVIDSNLSTVTAESDKLVRVGGPEPYNLPSRVPLRPRPGLSRARPLV